MADNDYSNDDKSYDLSDEDAPPTTSIDTFQTEIRVAFEQFRLTQDTHGAKLAEIVESSHQYTDELAHQRASIDH